MKTNMTRTTIALITAATATACSILGWIFRSNDILAIFGLIGLVLSLISYIIGGGLGKAIKAAFSLGKWGWLIMPFPIDIATGLFTLFVSIIFFLFVPIIFVGKAVLDRRANC